jgi:diguanylate cyclase (GGDEF)-like protein
MTERGPTENGRVLVVDDDRLFRQQFSDLLGERGFEVEQVASGEAAVRKVEQEAYDIVLLDMVMPKMDGLEALDRILAVRPYQSVIIVTAYGTIETAVQAMKRGAYYYLSKPVDEASLDAVIRNCAERSRLLRQNATLQQEALLDDQTTAYNRRFMETCLEDELARAKRYGRPLSILFFDLDNLKAINDRYGHLCGSRTLREVCQLVQRKLRKSDKLFRFGGDEFVVALPETDERGSYNVAQRIRRAVKANRFLAQEGLQISLTASIGIATFPQDGQTQEVLLQRADAALYQVKTTTRDAVAAWTGTRT